MNVGNIPRRSAIQFLNKTALVFEERRWSWSGFSARISRLSNSLGELGLKKGDKGF